MMFSGKDGRKPQTEARRYVYRCLYQTLVNDFDTGAGYLNEFASEFDRRRCHKAARAILKELERKGWK